jgi:hypothetical protein
VKSVWHQTGSAIKNTQNGRTEGRVAAAKAAAESSDEESDDDDSEDEEPAAFKIHRPIYVPLLNQA